MIVQPDFPDHWKTKLLIRLAGGGVDSILCLLRFWGHCHKRRKWEFDKLTPEILALICYWPGDPQIWWDAMTQTFIDVHPNKWVAHDWDVFNSALLGRWKGGDTNRKRIAEGKLPDSYRRAETKLKGSDRIGEDKKKSACARENGIGAQAPSSLHQKLKANPENKPDPENIIKFGNVVGELARKLRAGELIEPVDQLNSK